MGVKGLKTKEKQYFGRALRRFNTVRKILTYKVLKKIVKEFHPGAEEWIALYESLDPMEDDDDDEKMKDDKEEKTVDTDVKMTDENKAKEIAAKEELKRKKKEQEEKEREAIRALPEVQIYVHL